MSADLPNSDHAAENERVRVIRIVPRSQVWEGSRGRARSYLHLALRQGFAAGRLRRVGGAFLCGRAPGWYEDADARNFTHAARCPRCVSLAERYGGETEGAVRQVHHDYLHGDGWMLEEEAPARV